MEKKFKDTKIGIFLKSKAPVLLKKIGDILPDKGGLAIVKNIIAGDNKIKAIDKEQGLNHPQVENAEGA